MAHYNTSKDIVGYIKDLEDRIERLEKANPFINGIVVGGGITAPAVYTATLAGAANVIIDAAGVIRRAV